MKKPADMFARDGEWRSLSQFVARRGAGATLGVVYGRRRQGKTFLLDAACRAYEGFYFAATEATEAESLARLGAEIAAFSGAPGRIALADWHEAVDALLLIGREKPVPVVIDEFPYLVQASPELPSVIQRALTPRREERTGSRARLLLCGSAMSFMSRMLSGSAPLRGRAGLELVVHTLDFRQAAEFWGVSDQPRLAVELHAVVGGTPAYRREFVHDDTPSSYEELGPWIVRNVLDRDSPLFREARHLLAEEPNLRASGMYHSVLAAIAEGHTTRGGIAGFMGRKSSDLAHPLTVLEDAGLVLREEDAFRASRTSFTIAEPLVTFYHAVMRPERSRLDRSGMAEGVWERSRDRFRAQVVGPHFEAVCRDWTLHCADEDTVGGIPSSVGHGVLGDRAHRQSHEVDVVAWGHAEGTRKPLLAIGEAKWGEVMGMRHLERLRNIRALLEGRNDIDASAVRLLCFSGAGFTEELRNHAERTPDLVLVDAARLYD